MDSSSPRVGGWAIAQGRPQHTRHPTDAGRGATDGLGAAVDDLRRQVLPDLEAALAELGATTPGSDDATRAIATEVEAVVGALAELDALARDGGPAPASLVLRTVGAARAHCDGALALTAQSAVQVARSRRLLQEAAELRGRGEVRREDDAA